MREPLVSSAAGAVMFEDNAGDVLPTDGKSRASVGAWVIALAVFAGVLSTDLAIKAWAHDMLTEPVRITSWLALAVQHNSGLFLGALPVSAVSTVHWVVVCGALVWIGWRMVTQSSRTIGVGYALVAGGLTGNAIGRVQGAVIDYVGFGPIIDGKWLFMNLADLALIGGGLVLGVVLVRSRVQASRRQAA